MRYTFITLTVALIASISLALTEGAEKLVFFETQANAAAVRSMNSIPIPHLEIPIEMVGIDFAERIDPNILQSLTFEKDGKEYVRWVLNPEDTKWGNEVIAYFQKKGLTLSRKYYFTGYQTASRSYIVEDTTTGAQFSVKSSTNVTGGNWTDKKQPVGEAIDGRILSDFLAEQNRLRPFESFVFMDEPGILKIDELDQAVVIRDILALKEGGGKNLYLPGFSALHERIGAQIAAQNGSNDPYEFWSENYIKLVGRALGELAARTGIQFDSPHSQNFLIELDSNMKPTGRLVLRDMSDLYIDRSIIEAIQGKDSPILQRFTQSSNILSYIAAGFGPLHGNRKPLWVTESLYRQWLPLFFSEFEKSFKEISGYDLSDLKVSKTQSGDYFGASYRLQQDPRFQDFYRMLSVDGYIRNLGGKLSCEAIF